MRTFCLLLCSQRAAAGKSLRDHFTSFHAASSLRSVRGRQLIAETQIEDQLHQVVVETPQGSEGYAANTDLNNFTNQTFSKRNVGLPHIPYQAPVGTSDHVSATWAGRAHESLRNNETRDESWLWDHRCQQFSRMERRILITVTSHHPVEDKCLKLTELFRDVKINRLHLRQATYEDMMEVYLSYPSIQKRAYPYLEILFDLYHYMKGTFCSPSEKIVEYLMTALSRVANPNELNESRAHKLLLDSERYNVLPSKSTFTSYYQVCSTNNVMHIAIARFADMRLKLGVQPDESMCTAIIRGLIHNKHIDEAIVFISTMWAVPVDVYLLNACLEALGQSKDPLSAYSAYRAMLGSGVSPSQHTFWYLMLACENSGHWEETLFVLEQMHQTGTRGNASTLNLIIKGLLIMEQEHLASRMFLAMKRMKVEVWPVIECALPRQAREQTEKVLQGDEKKSTVRRQLYEKAVQEYLDLQTQTIQTLQVQSSLPQRAESGHARDKLDNKLDDSGVKSSAQIPLKALQLPTSITPRDDEHLKEIAALNRLSWVPRKYILSFLREKNISIKGKRDSSGQWKAPSNFLLHGAVNKYFFGIGLPSKKDQTILPDSFRSRKLWKLSNKRKVRMAESQIAIRKKNEARE